MITADRRVQFDFEVDFSNGGGLQGQDFRLDLAQGEISDQDLADYIVRDLRLLMVRKVRILNKRLISEQHKRSAKPATTPTRGSGKEPRFVDLSHTIVEGMVTYQGFPAPLVCDFLNREASRQQYAEGTTFQIGKIEMVGNTGTYLDSPFHRYADGKDLSELDLACLADLDALVVRVTGTDGRAVDREAFVSSDVRGKAVLVHTGWAQHWGSERYFEGHPFLTEAAAIYLKEQGAILVGIDSLNIDDTSGGTRPVHSTLLGAEILIVEHLRGLEQLPTSGFTFSAVPVKVKGMGTFPVRAFATLRG
ncbi:cyclase family protein [Deinococcus hopiensis]|uniref:cyclase family protein n=1 Tax=Deinococcus hopiensis TaxID=309885 RepID=UPI001BB01415|nr:cyclase family protein [Deinococcus hopiensis]